MKTIQRSSANIPLSRAAYELIIEILFKASAMGLLEQPVDVFNLDYAKIKKALKQITNAGFGKVILRDMDKWEHYGPEDEEILDRLKTLNQALEESPVPEKEWSIVKRYIPDDLLQQLLDIKESSLQRYSSLQRSTPDEVGRRLHTIALVIGDLSGAYNDDGIRQWFTRPRKNVFGGKAPIDLLVGNWEPSQTDPMKVRDFTRSLNHSIAT
jgi:uncharacterized protein (DUF2384 family)